MNISDYVRVVNHAATRGMRVGKAAQKLGFGHYAQLFSDAAALEFSRDFERVYTHIGRSCMTKHAAGVAEYYSHYADIEACTLHSEARILVNHKTRTYARKAYGNLCGRLIAALELLQYTEAQDAITADSRGRAPTKKVSEFHTLTYVQIRCESTSPIFGGVAEDWVLVGEPLPARKGFFYSDWAFTGATKEVRRYVKSRQVTACYLPYID